MEKIESPEPKPMTANEFAARVDIMESIIREEDTLIVTLAGRYEIGTLSRPRFKRQDEAARQHRQQVQHRLTMFEQEHAGFAAALRAPVDS